MTWRSVTSFRVLICLLASLAGRQLVAGMVCGQIQLVESKDSAVKKKKDYSGVAVWLTSSEWKEPQALSRKHVRMLQKDKTFSPHILAIETGTSVDFPNLDPIFHNAFSNFDGQIFDVALYPPGSSKTVRFERPGVVRVFCNIHPSMSAIIVVANSNYIAITNREGRYMFPNVAPGEYQIHFFHERATPETLEGVEKKITVSDEPAELPLTVISEAGYLPAGHKNKYGQDYPTNSEADSYSLPLQ